MCCIYTILLVYWCLYSSLGSIFAEDELDAAKVFTRVYSSNSKEGFITSPNFPFTSESEEEIRVYEFHGGYDERVQIIFNDFDLHKLAPNEKCERRNSFVSFERDLDEYVVFLCSPHRPLPLLSEKWEFNLKYKVPRNFRGKEKFRGFNASYKFITNLGINSGKQIRINECNFKYNSSNSTSGSFNSPNFPGFYPWHTKCRFTFHGKEKFLKLDFVKFNLLGGSDENCSSDTGDVLELIGTRNLVEFKEEHCGKRDPFSTTVDASFFTLLLDGIWSDTSDTIFEEPEFVGFQANYKFMDENEESSNFSISSSESSSQLMITVIVCLETSAFLAVLRIHC